MIQRFLHFQLIKFGQDSVVLNSENWTRLDNWFAELNMMGWWGGGGGVLKGWTIPGSTKLALSHPPGMEKMSC